MVLLFIYALITIFKMRGNEIHLERLALSECVGACVCYSGVRSWHLDPFLLLYTMLSFACEACRVSFRGRGSQGDHLPPLPPLEQVDLVNDNSKVFV